MRLILAALILITMHSSFALENERAVIVARYTGTALRDHNSFTFLPGEVVTILQSRDKSSLVESDSRSETVGGVWVPNEVLAFVRSFVKVEKWTGEKSVDREAGDYGASYYLDSTGAFKLEAQDGHLRKSVVLRGHLYGAKNILWARINGKNGAFPSQEFVFIVLPNGELCYPFESCDTAP